MTNLSELSMSGTATSFPGSLLGTQYSRENVSPGALVSSCCILHVRRMSSGGGAGLEDTTAAIIKKANPAHSSVFLLGEPPQMWKVQRVIQLWLN